MTTNLVSSSKTDARSDDPRALVIGDVDAHIFNCPACARPLSDGTNTCPGCGVHLIMGVRLKRAGAILALGVAIGLLLGGVGTAAAMTLSLRPHDVPAVVAPVASAVPSSLPASAPPSFAAFDPAAPQDAVLALSGTAVVNGRIAVDAQTLVAILARSNASTSEIARALRSLAADATLGLDQSSRLAPWRDAAETRVALEEFYRSMSGAAKQGLRASLSDRSSYRSAGVEMLDALRQLDVIDALSRALATTIDLELPPVVIPTGIASQG